MIDYYFLILLFLISKFLFLVFHYMYWQAINDNDIHNIVLSYLIHNCYRESVESFIACTGMKQPADYLEDMEKRKSRSFVIFHW